MAGSAIILDDQEMVTQSSTGEMHGCIGESSTGGLPALYIVHTYVLWYYGIPTMELVSTSSGLKNRDGSIVSSKLNIPSQGSSER